MLLSVVLVGYCVVGRFLLCGDFLHVAVGYAATVAAIIIQTNVHLRTQNPKLYAKIHKRCEKLKYLRFYY